MIPTVLALASIASLAIAQDCPSGYAPNTGTIPQNQTIEWTACPVDDEPTLECATLDVPIDYTNTDLGILTLPLVRVPANESAANGKSIVYNPGGPGASGIQSLIGSGFVLSSLAGGSYHIVTFDPRGVGLTIPYECPTVAAEPEVVLPLNDPIGLNATFVTNINQGNVCGEPEYKEAGELVGTAFVARDVNAIFEALNEDGLIRYWGFSYGTLLGATIAAMFPEKIDRVVLDGNINPTDYYHGLFEESVDNVDAALLNFFETCAAAGPNFCALAVDGFSGQELQDAFLEFLKGVKDETILVADSTGQFLVPYTQISSEVYGQLKSPSDWPETSLLIMNYYSSISSSRLTKREFDPLAAKDVEVPQSLSAITCGDWDDIDGSLNDFKDWLALYQERSSFGGDQLIAILYSCATWRVNAKEQFDGAFTDIETRTPLLFVNGPFDPVTPLTSAQNSSAGFVGSALLQHTGAGHCSTAQPSTCVFRKVASYFETGELPDTVEICQPDAAPFSGEVITPVNNTGPDLNSTSTDRSIDVDGFDIAVANAIHLLGKRDANFEYPAQLQGVKRDVYHAMVARQATGTDTSTLIPATCTPDSGSASSTGSSGSGSSSSSGSGAGLNAPPTFYVWIALAIFGFSALGASL